MTNVPAVTLHNGIRIPQLGFGVWQISNSEVGAALRTAIDAGYRSVDTAKLYRNERGVGEVIRSAGLPREEFFVTTKLWNDDHGYDRALRAFDASLDRLGLDYVDLYLIHWPGSAPDGNVRTWRALEKIAGQGRARAIGVSNFEIGHLRRLLDEADIVPAVNQVELNPLMQRSGLREFHGEHGIATEAWAPLARGRLLDDPVIVELAGRHGRTPAQIVLRWHIQVGTITIPKSVTPSRIASNINIFDFELSDGDMAALARLDRDGRTG